MNPRLSIIIPCYNCVTTLREALESCYKQSLKIEEFEIIMVDDGSIDDTVELMKTLATEHTNIKLLFHKKNRGGGAARNTGINNCKGEILYCLDSDNIFAPNSVIPILDFITKNDLDGAAFYERRFFFGSNIKKYSLHINITGERKITLLDLFNKNNTLLDNFFFTKKSYTKTAGYPEHHGFDTQCFEMRYLLAGNNVSVCPNSIFYHRQAMKEKSYFERVHASGHFSVNFSLIFEDIFHILTEDVQNEIINFPIFNQNKSYGNNILDLVKGKVLRGENIFIENYTNYLLENSRNYWLEKNHNSLVYIFDAITKNKNSEANIEFVSYIKNVLKLSPYLEFLNLRILQGLSGISYSECVKRTLYDIGQLQIKPLQNRGGAFMEWARKHEIIYQTIQQIKKITTK